jgi:ATP-binding cassette, subfamily B (MDR/TAP), member 1
MVKVVPEMSERVVVTVAGANEDPVVAFTEASTKERSDDPADEIVDLKQEVKETDKEKKERETKEKAAKLQEYGGPASIIKLFSLATGFELFVYFIGILGAAVHGIGQPVLCVMFGQLIDALSIPPLPPNVAVLIAAGNFTISAPSGDKFFGNVQDVAINFILIGIGVMVVASIQGFCFPWFVERQLQKMRPLYFDACLHRDVGWFDTHDVGALPAELGQDLDTYADGLGTKLGVSIMSASGVLCGFIIGLFLSWQVALVMTAAIPLLGVGAAAMGKSIMELMQETQGAYARASQCADEVLFAIRTVVAFSGEQRELTRYSKAVDEARRGGIKGRIKTGIGMGWIWLAYFLSMSLAFWFGMRLVYNGVDLSVGKMMSAFFCVLTAGFTIGQIPPGLAGLIGARTAMARFYYITTNDSVIQRRIKEDRKAIGAIETLQLKDVHFSYPARPDIKILNGLTLTIQKGQKVAVVGESGSGKSTVMALLERFYDPIEGSVLVNGEDLKLFAVSSYRKQIGYVGQEPVLFATSVRNNIMQGSSDASEEDFLRATQYAQLDFIKSLPGSFDTYVGSGGSQFSGGQKQRIAIARALLKKPSVLFLDEATSALDSASEKMIQATIDEIGSRSDLGMTIVTIAHRLSTVRNSDVIYVLKNGVVEEQGTHAQLTAKDGGLYQALAAAQALAGLQRQVSDKDDKQELKKQDNDEDAAQLKAEASKYFETKNKDEEEDEETKLAKKIAKEYKVPMTRLLWFAKKELWALIPGFFGAMISGACFPVLGTYILVNAMVAFIQANIDKEKMKTEVENAALYFVIVGVVKFTATIFQFAGFGLIGESITRNCRVDMLTAIFRQEIGYHDDPDHTPGKLVKGLQVNAYRIASLCITLGDRADALCSIVVGVTIAFIACWEMSAGMLLSIPVFGIAQGIQIAVVMGGSQKNNDDLKKSSQVLADSLMNARTVQAAGNEKDLLKLYTGMVDGVSKDITKKELTAGFAFGFANGVIFWVCAAGFWFMGWLIKDGRTDFEKGQRAFMGILYAAMGAGMAFSLSGDLAKAKIAAFEVFQVIDRKSAINGLEATGKSPGITEIGRFEFTNVEFYYPFRPDVKVLKGLSFTIQAGQSVGIVGPSGSGKSTVMSLIQRFYDPMGGSVLIGQQKIALSTIDVRWWRKQIGYVGQEPILFDSTVLENVKYGLEATEEVSADHLEKCKRMANLNFLDNHKAQGWETRVGPRGSRLSGGQKQRVAICRALVRNPPILLLDEATSALDSQSEKVVSAALEAARIGRTSIAIAHRLSTIQDCDVIIVVAEGLLVEKGSHQELMDMKGVYYKLQTGKKGDGENGNQETLST